MTSRVHSRVVNALTFARVPLIPDYNTEGDVQKSVEALRAMGVTRVDPFRYLRKEA